jgi:hypothetical protein
MRFLIRNLSSLRFSLFFAFLLALAFAPAIRAQASYTAQLTGVITDSSGGVIASAKITLTDEATNVPISTTTNDKGIYVLTGLRPAKYTLRAEAPGFNPAERRGITLAVSQQTTLDLSLAPGGVTETVTVTEQVPLLDTGNAALGADVTNEYVRDMPLINRSMFGLVFLAGGVTETTGSGTQDSYPTGTNFVSNGQRNATAEVRVDGALASAPEQGEGGTTNVYYQPSVEIVQEFKVENNSFSAEYGNNGGTVVNMVLKEGGNKFHGSGWWFGQRSALDANDFFNNSSGVARPDHLRDQYGFSLGGPIRREKTFFFLDFEETRQHDPVNFNGTVPTDNQRNGIFTGTLTADPNTGLPVPQDIFNPRQPTCVMGTCTRPQFTNDVIPQQFIDPIGQALLKLYPEPNATPDQFGLNNYRSSTLTNAPAHAFDVKIDHHFNDKMRVAGRYSQSYSEFDVPFVLGSGSFNDGYTSSTSVHNVGLEYNWSLTPTILWTSRLALDRVNAPVNTSFGNLNLTSVGFPSILASANGLNRMPAIVLDGTNNWISMFTQCCTDTKFAHTLYSYSSALAFVHGRHTLKTGFEQRQFFNNFWQPNYPTGYFSFPQSVTASVPGGTSPTEGNSFASLLLGYGDPGSSLINVLPQVADKSMETAFYVQDDWKITSRLMINLGLRYEWSSPYTERFNHQQYSDFTGDTGVSIVLQPGQAPTELKGTTLFPGQGGLGRSVPTDRNNFAPRLGFAFSLDQKTVIRGGVGIYYGLSPATNYQYPGTAFSASAPVLFTQDNFQTSYATLGKPFPQGLPVPQGQAYGKLAEWGYDNNNNLGTEQARNADIYQWNLGVQRLLPEQITIGVDYSANRSTHLPWGGYSSTRNRNFLSSATLAQISAQQHAADPLGAADCDANSCVSNYLQGPVANPFLPYFQPGGMFQKETASPYALQQVPLIDLLRPYPQFSATFQGLPNFGANSWYHSMQIRFQKRASHYVSFEGNYTLSKSTDTSSIGANAFVGGLNTVGGLTVGNPQQLDHLNLEHAISANDATHRMVLATILEVPVGRGRWVGRDMNRFLDGAIGGWAISGILTLQSGQPLAIAMSQPRLADGNQRPDVLCPQVSSGISYHHAAATGESLFNAACFGDPGDNIPGNAPRYFSNLRGDGIHNKDLSISKEFVIREGMKLQLRGEFFNFTNTPRFAFPDLGVGSGTFGQVTSTAPGSTPRHSQIGVRFEF